MAARPKPAAARCVTRRMTRPLAILLAALGFGLGAPAGEAVARPLVTGIQDPAGPGFREPDRDRDYRLIAASGATTIRMPVSWSAVAPKRPGRPEDPADPGYRWAELDARVASAAASGLAPIISVAGPAQWALQPGTSSPSIPDVAAFARAIALHYPEVRYWQAWNEPNLDTFPGQPADAEEYRALVNAFGNAVKGVRASNLVIAGGLAPWGGAGPPGSRRGSYGARPLPFMRDLLCVRGARAKRRTCSQPLAFDIWAHHPYTSGGPTHSAAQPGDVSLADIPEMGRLLDRAWRLGAIRTGSRPRFWATEFSWDTNPPDGGGLPLDLHARWLSEALYRMWRARVSQVTWFQLRDKPMNTSPTGIWQSGLYFVDGTAKPALTAFRFPFVAFRSGRRAAVWGRTPAGDARRVRIEQLAGSRWRTLRVLRSNGDGIFRAHVRRRGRGTLRARIGADTSLPFSLRRPRDRYVNPFGTGAAPE